jgi:hypothetical protein
MDVRGIHPTTLDFADNAGFAGRAADRGRGRQLPDRGR